VISPAAPGCARAWSTMTAMEQAPHCQVADTIMVLDDDPVTLCNAESLRDSLPAGEPA